jgi:hypothetical protein
MIRGLLMAQNMPVGVVDAVVDVVEAVEPVVEAKVKRKVGKYQREFGRQLKALKRKHPRTRVQALMKRAHRLTKKVMRG